MADNSPRTNASNHSTKKTSLGETLRKITKTLYRSTLEHSPLSLLEKSAMRGEKVSFEFEKTPKKEIEKPNNFHNYLKSQHRAVEKMTQILELPKQPFGIHKNYNAEEEFIEKHFVFWNDQETLKRNKEIDVLSRKFRLFDRRELSSRKVKTRSGSNRKVGMDEFEVYEMGAGNLVCEKEVNAIKAYEQQKIEYSLLLNRNSENVKERRSIEMKKVNRAAEHVRKFNEKKNKLFKRRYAYSAAVSPAGKNYSMNKLKVSF